MALYEGELAPCPFCGNKNVLMRDVEYDKMLWLIECNGCQMEMTVKRIMYPRKKSNRDAVAEVWNRRAAC